MAHIKYTLLSLLLVTTFACSKKSETKSPTQKYSDKPLHIERAFFTNPRLIQKKQSDISTMNGVIAYLNHTPKGAVVHINIYLFAYTPILQAIKDAYKRGVTIKMLIDNQHDKHTRNVPTILELQRILESPSEIIKVDNDARSSLMAINHNKYILFSEVHLPNGIAKNLVWASSHNFTLGQAEKLEDAIAMTNKKLYDAFLDNWNEIAKYADHGMRNFEYSVNDIGDSVTAFFFPRLENEVWDGKSTIIEELDKLSEYKKDTICVLMSEMHASIGLKIAKKLTELANEGANVQVITKLEAPAVDAAVKSELENNLVAAGGYVKLINSKVEGTVHSKTMLIKGVYKGKMQRIILTGSLNYHTNATGSNNNFLLLLKNSSLFDDYWNNWRLVKELF